MIQSELDVLRDVSQRLTSAGITFMTRDIDLVIRLASEQSDQYRQQEFARRRLVSLGDFETWIVSREDLILSKLYWTRDSKSELQLRDVKNLLMVECDMSYLFSCAEDLGVKALLTEVLQRHE